MQGFVFFIYNFLKCKLQVKYYANVTSYFYWKLNPLCIKRTNSRCEVIWKKVSEVARIYLERRILKEHDKYLVKFYSFPFKKKKLYS
jgi:hypothetical protein